MHHLRILKFSRWLKIDQPFFHFLVKKIPCEQLWGHIFCYIVQKKVKSWKIHRNGAWSHPEEKDGHEVASLISHCHFSPL